MNTYLYSEKWKYWDVTKDDCLCLQCYKKYGTIFSIDETIEKHRPHFFCRCTLSKLGTIEAGKMIFGGVYYNDDNKLPSRPGRIWYEADINYISGWRNNSRVVFSNDGLIFVTYDHYDTFFEII